MMAVSIGRSFGLAERVWLTFPTTAAAVSQLWWTAGRRSGVA